MPFEAKWEDEGVYWRFYGTVSGEDVLRSNRTLYHSPRLDRTRYQVADFLEVESIHATVEDARKLAAYDTAMCVTKPEMRVAVVMKDEIIGALSEIYKAHMDGSPWDTQLFSDVDDAFAWARQEE